MIDKLRKWGTKPQYSGLGFIFIHEPDRKTRWNFYCPKLTPVEVDDFHTHRIKFESEIIQGMLINEVCKWKHGGNLQIVETNCISSIENKVIEDEVAIYPDGEYHIPAGGWYISEADTFHRVRCPIKTITRLHILDRETENNLTIRSKKKAFRCPLKDFQRPENELWEILREF